ncbi:MAG: hypothetical protein ABIW03_00280 [Sphingomicrobium sp.]
MLRCTAARTAAQANIVRAATSAQSARMTLIGFTGIIAALFMSASNAWAEPTQLGSRVGDTYEITMIREFSEKNGDTSSGSSYDKDTIIERVIGVRADGLELEYDLPKSSTADERGSNWQLPARVFRQFRGPAQLVNVAELEARLEAWLKAAKWPRTVCGHWIFTWNAFRIECDPQSVIKTVDAFDLRSADLREGAPYQEPGILGLGTLAKKAAGPNGEVFTVEMSVDPDAVRRASADSDVVIGELLKKPVTLEVALRERAKETISGRISVAYYTDSVGSVRRRTKVTNLETKWPDGRSETMTVTETLERRLISRRD